MRRRNVDGEECGGRYTRGQHEEGLKCMRMYVEGGDIRGVERYCRHRTDCVWRGCHHEAIMGASSSYSLIAALYPQLQPNCCFLSPSFLLSCAPRAPVPMAVLINAVLINALLINALLINALLINAPFPAYLSGYSSPSLTLYLLHSVARCLCLPCPSLSRSSPYSAYPSAPPLLLPIRASSSFFPSLHPPTAFPSFFPSLLPTLPLLLPVRWERMVLRCGFSETLTLAVRPS